MNVTPITFFPSGSSTGAFNDLRAATPLLPGGATNGASRIGPVDPLAFDTRRRRLQQLWAAANAIEGDHLPGLSYGMGVGRASIVILQGRRIILPRKKGVHLDLGTGVKSERLMM